MNHETLEMHEKRLRKRLSLLSRQVNEAAESAVETICFRVVDLSGFNLSAGKLFTSRVDINATRSPGFHAEHVDIKDETLIGLGREPVDIVFEVSHRGASTDSEGLVECRLDDHEVLADVFHTVVVPPVEFPLHDQERCRHVVVSVRHDGPIFV